MEEYKLRFFFFLQVYLNIKDNFEYLYQSVDCKRLLSMVVGVVRSSCEKPLDIHDTTFSVLTILFKV